MLKLKMSLTITILTLFSSHYQ
ncbi:hypothetical protein E2320_022912 [Naja naja]|nr:hypothetical protein E2320_022912 [Naja naja]